MSPPPLVLSNSGGLQGGAEQSVPGRARPGRGGAGGVQVRGVGSVRKPGERSNVFVLSCRSSVPLAFPNIRF